MGKKCDIILDVVIKEVRGYEKPGPTGIISEGRQKVYRTFLQLLQIFRYDKR